jgi:hypothetical protein
MYGKYESTKGKYSLRISRYFIDVHLEYQSVGDDVGDKCA